MMWRRQYTKELSAHRGEVAILAGALILWYAFLFSRFGRWPSELIVGLSWLPLSFLPVWTLWSSLQLYRQEWRERTHYLLLSLPVPARTITSAKLAALLTGLLGFSTVIIVAAGWATWRAAASIGALDIFASVPAEWVVGMAFRAYLLGAFALTLLAVTIQFSYVFSRMFTRFQGLVLAWVWFVSMWLMGRLTGLGSRLLAWLPDFHVRFPEMADGTMQFHTATVDSGPLVTLLLIGVGIYTLLNVTLERAVEV